MTALREPSDLGHADLLEVVTDVREILWTEGDPRHEWSTDTIEHVADVLIRKGLRPAEAEEDET